MTIETPPTSPIPLSLPLPREVGTPAPRSAIGPRHAARQDPTAAEIAAGVIITALAGLGGTVILAAVVALALIP